MKGFDDKFLADESDVIQTHVQGITKKEYIKSNVKSQLAIFGDESSSIELHAIIHPSGNLNDVDSWTTIIQELEELEYKNGFNKGCRLFLRLLLSDTERQLPILRTNFPEYFGEEKRDFISVIEQKPLSDARMVLWVYDVKGNQSVEQNSFGKVFQSNGLKHIWIANMLGEENQNVCEQTETIFNNYIGYLKQADSDIYNHAIRTWLFVDDIDNNYTDVVIGRKGIFEEQGLTEQTHYIASTGIAGKHENSDLKVTMDAYSVSGIFPEQIRFLLASDNMCPTHRYGVTFERGTEVIYGDRKHVYISGTASINTQGEVIFLDDVEKQTYRVFENINALLTEAKCSVADLSMLLVYLRNQSDYEKVDRLVQKLYPEIPYVILHAPVCRPTWLVEIEGIAIKKVETDFPCF
ncbi:Rid family hydrolase [Sunxiuqinia sp. A32]|uniref:Rid family hydrolase n=1 Tax=Sunxiuqinia sp. A32 TaxID=3461496 RepID=UPI0040467FEC